MNKNEISVDKIVELSEGTLLSRGTASTVKSFCCDTRKIKTGDVFLSIKSETDDGIKYIEEAFEKGVVGCITEYDIQEELINKYRDRFIIKTKDTTKAIQEIAKYKRSLYDIPVIAVTGSVGKTSTKDMIATVLSQKYIVNKTEGNYNNHLGVPLTILSWDNDTEVAVVEMGMNHFGEISVLTNIAKPTIAVITNIGTAHIGNLGSRENILKAKLEILEGLQTNGKVIVNNDNDLLNQCDTKEFKKLTYGINNKSDLTANNIVLEENFSDFTVTISDKEYVVNVPVAGEHFIMNSLCAILVGLELNIEINKIIEGIKTIKLTAKRNEIIDINGIKLINDYYNASYDSMKASLEVLGKINAKRKIAILGDMLELGDFSEQLHKKVGEEVINNRIDILITVGELSKSIAEEAKNNSNIDVYCFENNSEAIKRIDEITMTGDAILLKASNRMNFGEIADHIKKERNMNE